MAAQGREHLRPSWMLKVPRVPLTEETKAYFRRLRAQELPVSRGRWYRLHVHGESPVVRGFVWLRVSDDLATSGATLRVKLSLPLWTPVGFKDFELDTTATECSAKNAKR